MSNPQASHVAAVERVLSRSILPFFICVRECKSAINKKESSVVSLAIFIAGSTAPKRFPRWGVPVD